MQRSPSFRVFALAALLVASLCSGCGLFKKCGGCPSFSQRSAPAHQAVATADANPVSACN